MSAQGHDEMQEQEDHAGRCEPAHGLIQRLGGYSQVALYVRRYGVNQSRAMNRSTVYRWTVSTDEGGTGGYIPAKHWPALIKAARDHHSMALTVHDFSPSLANALAAALEAANES